MTVSTAVVFCSRERAFHFSAMFALLASQCMISFSVLFSDAYLIQPITSHRSSRYFTGEALLPPLERLDDGNNDNTISDGMLSVMYTNDRSQVSTWLSDHVPSEGCTLGFDLESCPDLPWRRHPNAFHGPAVVQLATKDSALVVHLTRSSGSYSRACRPLLEAVLSDEVIVKAGCGIDMDMLELRSVWRGLEARSRLDLGGLRANHRHNTPGLKKLAASILGVDLPKSRRIATSDWSRFPLSVEQVTYSAWDAWVGAAVTEELARRDPSTFGTLALTERLRTQRSVEELYQRQRRRKRAKLILSSLMAPYNGQQQSEPQQAPKQKRPNRADLPRWKVEMAHKLRRVVKANSHGSAEVIADVNSLGFHHARSTANSTFTE